VANALVETIEGLTPEARAALEHAVNLWHAEHRVPFESVIETVSGPAKVFRLALCIEDGRPPRTIRLEWKGDPRPAE
jgi:hypothetical protein